MLKIDFVYQFTFKMFVEQKMLFGISDWISLNPLNKVILRPQRL